MLQPGDHIGPYLILSRIGAGGMGEVYKARDPRLDRDVAIKVSKTGFSERFTREAKAVALHPDGKRVALTVQDFKYDLWMVEGFPKPVTGWRHLFRHWE